MDYDYEFTVGEEYSAVSYTFADALDVTSPAVLTLTLKRDRDQSSADITIADTNFDKTNAATGTVTWAFDSDHLDTAATYYGEMKAVLSATNTVKEDFIMRVRTSVS